MNEKKRIETRLLVQARYGLLLGVLIVAVMLLYIARGALLPIIIGWFLAFLLNPLIDRMERRGISRGSAIAFLLGITLVALTIIVVFFLPYFGHEMIRLSSNLVNQTKLFLVWLTETYNITIPSTFSETIDTYGAKLQAIAPDVASWVGVHLSGVFARLGALVGFILNAILVPVFAYYFLLDFHSMDERFLSLVPHSYRSWTRTFLDSVDKVLSGFFYGQLLVGMAQGALFAIGLTLLGIDFGAVIGLLAGLFAIVPYLGYAVGIVLALLMALLATKSLGIMLGVVLLFFGVNIIENFYLTPKLVGDKVGLSPIIVIMALIFFGELFGLAGLLIAVPATAVMRILWQDLEIKYRQSNFFLQGDHPFASQEDLDNVEKSLTTLPCRCGGTLSVQRRTPLDSPLSGARLHSLCMQCGKEQSLQYSLRMQEPDPLVVAPTEAIASPIASPTVGTEPAVAQMDAPLPPKTPPVEEPTHSTPPPGTPPDMEPLDS